MRSIKQGVNQTVTLNLSFDPSILVAAELCFRQQGSAVVTKNLQDCVIEGNSIRAALSQYDTLKFSPQRISLTLRGKYADGGTVIANDIPFIVERSDVQEAI